MSKSTKSAPVAVTVEPTPLRDAQELASKRIAGLTQDQILALWQAGQFGDLDEGALWRAYMLRIAARQARKSAKSESEAA